MAIAKITLTCTECGKTFEHRKECRNRADADSHEAWARENIDLCPDCYRAQQQRIAQAAVLAALESHSITLPQLTGASDKQIAYAQSVRIRALADSISRLDTYVKFRAHAAKVSADPEFAKQCEARGMSVAEAYVKSLRLHCLDRLHLALTATTARDILDNLH